MLRLSWHILSFSFSLLFLISSCEKELIPVYIVPESGYNWPSYEREYWPTLGWELAAMEDHNMDPEKMAIADQFAEDDPLTRALLVIKDGYLVFENYYGDGGVDESTNLWSVTKGFSSALIGLLFDQNTINSTTQLMADLMPAYPEFGEIRLEHVLTQTTGLSWSESGPPWVEWILSNDWVASALARGQVRQPGEIFKYSSGNSHFLTSLVYYSTGIFPGRMAKERLLDPMGIPFDTMSPNIDYYTWDQYTEPLDQTWRRDPKGIETASFALYLTARDMAKFGFLYLNRGRWEDQLILSEEWIVNSTKDCVTNVYERYSYGYQWWITLINGHPAFLASGFGGQIIGVVPSLDMVVVLKYEAEDPVNPETGSGHDDMRLFELAAAAAE